MALLRPVRFPDPSPLAARQLGRLSMMRCLGLLCRRGRPGASKTALSEPPSRVLVPGSLPFVIVCVLLLCTAMGVLAADGTHGWLITSHAGGQDSAGAVSGEKRGESVAQGQGKTALGPQGKTT